MERFGWTSPEIICQPVQKDNAKLKGVMNHLGAIKKEIINLYVYK